MTFPRPARPWRDRKADRATWAEVLASTPFAGRPLNALSLSDVLGNTDVKTRLAALPLKDVSFVTMLLKSVHWSSLLIGPAKLLTLPAPPGFNSWCGGANPALSSTDCATITASTSVLQADVEGHLGSAPVGSIPVGSIPVGSIPVGSISIAATDVAASRLAAVQLADVTGDLASIVSCSLAVCPTLGDAYAKNAIQPTVTFLNPQVRNGIRERAHHGQRHPLGDPRQGRRDRAAVGEPRRAGPAAVLRSAPARDLHGKRQCRLRLRGRVRVLDQAPRRLLPDRHECDGDDGAGAPQNAGTASVEGSDAVSAHKLNTYTWDLSCGEGDTGTKTATLKFDAFVGLKVGTFKTSVVAKADSFSIATDGGVAPVTVLQNGEPANDTPDSAQAIGSDTLVVGHIPVSGDQDFYNINLDGLPRGSQIAVFLNTPSGTDLDLTVSKPARQSFFSTPVGSIPVGSIPIEDSGVGFTNGALPPRRSRTCRLARSPWARSRSARSRSEVSPRIEAT